MMKTVLMMVMMMMTVMNLDIIVNDDDGDDLKGITSVLVIRSIFGHGLPARGQRLSTPGLFYLTLVKTRQGQDDIQSGSPTLFQEMGWGTNVENKNGYKSIQVSVCFRCLPMGECDTYFQLFYWRTSSANWPCMYSNRIVLRLQGRILNMYNPLLVRIAETWKGTNPLFGALVPSRTSKVRRGTFLNDV